MQTTTYTEVISTRALWGGGRRPLGVSYGKLMMWIFILSDALTFSGFLAAYGFSRFKFVHSWPEPDEVFSHVPLLGGGYPMIYVAFMTFVLIFSSVTMVLAVHAGHEMRKNKVVVYLFLTIIGGGVFLSSQAWEWYHFIKGEAGALQLNDGSIVHFVKPKGMRDGRAVYEKISLDALGGSSGRAVAHTLPELKRAFEASPGVQLRMADQTVLAHNRGDAVFAHAKAVVRGANLVKNEYGLPQFADFFFFITGFHGFHVFTGVILNVIVFLNVLLGTYEGRGHYEMVEKVGLYWHFVDLVWVFVFTFFYLI